MLRNLVVAACCVSALLPAASASATIRYATPNGATSGLCNATGPSNLPCRLERAVTVAQTGDEVRLAAGTYNQTSAPVSITKQLLMRAPAESPRPVILDSDNGTPVTIAATGGGTTLRHLEIRSQGASSASALAVQAADATIEDVVLKAAQQCAGGNGADQTYVDVVATLTGVSGTCLNLGGAAGATLRRVTATAANGIATAAAVGVLGTVEDATFSAGGVGLLVAGALNGATVRRVRASGQNAGIMASGKALVTDTLATASGLGAIGVGHGSGLAPLTLRNVTAIASGQQSRGLFAAPGWLSSAGGVIEAKNVIARGDGSDLRPQATDATTPCLLPECPPGVITISHSNLRNVGGGGTINFGPGIQAGDPRFVAPGDFRLADDSPAIDAGLTDLLGPAALDGAARVQGASVDLGAFERAPVPPPVVAVEGGPGGPPNGPPVEQTPPPPPPPDPDTVAPRLSGASLVKARVKRGKAVGLRLTSSEAATLTVTVVRRLRGARRGGRCVAGAKASRRCTVRRVVRTLTLALTPGGNVLALKAGRLPVGRLSLELQARDAAGNGSALTRLPLRVRR